MPALPPSRAPARIAFLGFSAFERTALASYFRLAADREPRFELVYTLTDADYLVADADHGPSVQLVVVTERLAETVFIGSPAPPGAAAWMRRPIDALRVMKALDALAQARGDASPAPATAPPVARPPVRAADPPAPAGVPPLLPESGVIVESMLRMPPPATPAPGGSGAPGGAVARQPAGVPETVPPVLRTLAPRPTPAPSAPSAPSGAQAFVGPPPPPRALVVDDSDIARRFLTSRLLPWGVRSDTAVSSAQVIDLLALRSYDLIFLDVELGPDSELDGLALCRHIKRSALAISAAVIVVSAHHSEVDRARGSLAGCDVYLGKPVKEAELAALLRRQGLVPPEGLGVRPALGSVPAPAPLLVPLPAPVPEPSPAPAAAAASAAASASASASAPKTSPG